jgi:hypothetical protein
LDYALNMHCVCIAMRVTASQKHVCCVCSNSCHIRLNSAATGRCTDQIKACVTDSDSVPGLVCVWSIGASTCDTVDVCCCVLVCAMASSAAAGQVCPNM